MEERIEGFRLSPQQRNLWRLQSDSAAYRVQCSMEVHGPCDRDRLRETVRKVAARHDILATRFVGQAGIRFPLQVIGQDPGVLWSEAEADDASQIGELARREREQDFDPESGQALRVLWVELAGDRRVLIFTSPALMADTRTLELLLAETLEAYAGTASPAEDEETVQYVQFSEWQNELRESGDAADGEAYWSRLTTGPGSRVDLPVQKAVAEPRPYRPAWQDTDVAVPGLDALAEELAVPVPVVLLAVWQVLLRRHLEGPTFVVSALLENRDNEDLRNVLGPLARAVPLRCRLAGDESLARVVSMADEALQEAADWQEFFSASPGEGPERLPGGYPIGFEAAEWSAKLSAADLEFSLATWSSCCDRFKLQLSCLRAGESWVAGLRYDPEVFSSDDVSRLSERFAVLLRSAVEVPQSSVNRLELIGDGERRFLLDELNQTRSEYPRDRCLHELLAEQASRTPDGIAVSFEDQQLSYGELDARAERLSSHLRGLGVGPDQRVAIYLGRCLELPVAILGVLKAGGAYVALDTDQPRERLEHLVADARPQVLLTRELLKHGAPDSGAKLLCLDSDWEAMKASSGRPAPRATPADLAYVCFTSGSSGRPKGVMVPHRGLVNYLTWCVERYRVAEGRGATVHSPLGFDLTVTSLFAPLLVGGCVRLVPEEQGVDRLGDTLHSEGGFSLIKITPAHLEVLSQSLTDRPLARRTRSLVLGGEALLGEALSGWRRQAPETRLYNEYGPTETVVGCCVYESDLASETSGAVPIGRPIANSRLYLLDAEAAPVPFGMTGELWVGGAGVTRGYLNQPATTAAAFLPDPFGGRPGARLYKTGDLVSHRPSGDLVFRGRRDHQVKIRGARIEPGEVEAVLLGHPGVREGVVVAREDDGERVLVGYAVARDEPVGTEELRGYLGERLPDYMVPSVYVWLDALPLNVRGKLDRKRLPAPSSGRPDLESIYEAPRNVVEEVLAGIWADVLRIDEVGIRDNFFSLGGDSIRSVRVVALAREKGLHITVQQLFMHRTIAELAQVAETAADFLAANEQDAEKLSTLLSELEGVSEDEARKQLREKMRLGDREGTR